MRLQSKAFVLCIVLITQAGAAAKQQPAKSAAQGIVKHARTGEPIAGASVSLHDAYTPPNVIAPALAAVFTDSRGEFLLPGIDAGVYRFSVGSNGFVRYDAPRLTLT